MSEVGGPGDGWRGSKAVRSWTSKEEMGAKQGGRAHGQEVESRGARLPLGDGGRFVSYL